MEKLTTEPEAPTNACRQPGCCGAANRRDFLELVGLGAAALLGGQLTAYAGPFELTDFEKLVPADKKLSADWVRSLTERGAPDVYRGAQLAKIGMPIGGIGAGQLYLGGDGRLWRWDIFNAVQATGDAHYAQPPAADSPVEQGFGLKLSTDGQTRVVPLDRRGFGDVAFRGEYPIGRVEYRDPQLPVSVDLEAFSPFIPLNVDDSSLPATVLRFTLRNTGREKVTAEIAGWLQNPVCQGAGLLQRSNTILRRKGLTMLECAAREVVPAQTEARDDILFEDFEKPTYAGWTSTGTAFGEGPIEKAKMPAYQGQVGAEGDRLVNSHNTRGGEDVRQGDAHVGTLTSPAFKIERNYIRFLIGGGSHAGKTCVNLLVDGKVVLSEAGKNDNRMRPATFDVRSLQGRPAKLEIVDNEPGGWGNIGVDTIVFGDRPAANQAKLVDRPDFGTLVLGLLGAGEEVRAVAGLPDGGVPPGTFESDAKPADVEVRPFDQKLTGSLARSVSLAPGEEQSITFVVCWHFPNLRLDGLETDGRWYARRFKSAVETAEYVTEHFDRLAGDTRRWRDTWYDSTLPYWFLDRTLLNISTLATSTCYRFGNGRFYGWEGVGCCPGTCTHVWHYAQAVGRLFPALESDTRERVDLGISFDATSGVIDHRGEFHAGEAVDGQAGTILRCLREHQMSADDQFLRRNWPRIRQAMLPLIERDGNGDGILEGPQHNTLDAAWFGKIPWLSGLYLAALRAAEEMALEMDDGDFARRCRKIFEVGRGKLDEQTWREDNGYFVQIPDPANLRAVGSFDGCSIDQVLGPSWSHQVGLGEILPRPHVRRALESLWRYNFTPDVGPYRQEHKAGRWYAMAGEGGLLMVTHPFGPGPTFKDDPSAWSAMYFNECMTGFEYQVAWHMIAVGMVTEGLAIARTIHDRYHAARRNPWNEVECGDHYARAMASYGLFLTACGFEYHGPRRHIGFAPSFQAEVFKAAFTAAEGWGSYTQQLRDGRQECSITLAWGRLRLKSLSFSFAGKKIPTQATLHGPGGKLAAKVTIDGDRVRLVADEEFAITAPQKISVFIS